MNRIIARTEEDDFYRPIIGALHPSPEPTAPDAISAAASQVAATIGAAAIVNYTTSGSTALRSARERPRVPILVLTSKLATARRLTVLWGAHTVHTADVKDFQEMVGKACSMAVQEEFGRRGDKVVITAGVPFGTPGATNVLRIAWIER
jgi:pyruvate kinase